MASMNEMSAEDSISRRGSSHSQRGNSNTQHAAAIAAANSVSIGNHISGPRPPPSTVKQARPWAFTNFDKRTKEQLAASVTEASQVSATRQWVGGPRALPLSERALQTGVLPPPVCFDPKIPDPVGRPNEKETTRQVLQKAPNEPGTWRKDWSALAADTGHASAPNSTATTPASTPGIEYNGPVRPGNRCLSPVVEVDDRRFSGIAQPVRQPAASSSRAAAIFAPQPLRVPPASHTTTVSFTTSAGRPRYSSAPTSQPPPPYVGSTKTTDQHHSAPSPYTSASLPRQPPATVPEQRRASSPARIRLIRAQEALRVHGSKTTVAVLRRPQRLAGERVRGPDQPTPAANVTRPGLLRMPGSYGDE